MKHKSYTKVSGNVWIHLAGMNYALCTEIHDVNSLVNPWCIELLKARFWRCCAPLLLEPCSKYFFIHLLRSCSDIHDGNPSSWSRNPVPLLSSATGHVGDYNVLSTQTWLYATCEALEEQFGKSKFVTAFTTHASVLFKYAHADSFILHHTNETVSRQCR